MVLHNLIVIGGSVNRAYGVLLRKDNNLLSILGPLRHNRMMARHRRNSRVDSEPVFNDPSAGDVTAGAQAYSRRVSRAEYLRQRRKSKRNKIIAACLIAVLVLCVGGVGVAFAYFNTITTNMNEGVDDELRDQLVKTDIVKEPFYMLLMGTDKSEEREQDEDVFRSDTIMLVRIDPVDKKVTLVSLHRDTSVDMGKYGQQKLNAAYAFGGPAYAVETVSGMADVPISHYAEINFDGFQDVVDALGGIEVDVPMEIDDDDAGGYVAAGLHTLNGEEALILCRARHVYDDYGDGDEFRAANQRLVMGAIAKKILSADIGTMVSTVEALSKHITTSLSGADMVSLAQALQGLDPDTDIYSAMEPTTSAFVNGGWYEYVNKEAWNTMMSRVDQGLPPTEEDVVDEASGTVLAATGSGAISSGGSGSSSGPNSIDRSDKLVVVKNGSGKDGVAAAAGEKLETVGYKVQTGNADGFDYPTTIVIYSQRSQGEEAKEIANLLGIGKAQFNDGTYAFDSDFLVVVGADWSE